MKKFFIIAALLLAASLQLGAIPAYRGLVPYTQPDGKVIQIRLHGDEFYHWATDTQGRVLEQREDGFFSPVSSYTHHSRLVEAQRRRAAVNAARVSSISKRKVVGQQHFLVILVAFSDVEFASSTANADFTDLMNKNGYSVNGATGSARDFYYDNSHGQFEPIFDVYGPVTLKKNRAYYGGNSSYQQGSDKQPHLAVKEGLEALAESIDFSKYDNDNDGEVDLVFMYYAGKGENDGGGTECIWPHQWNLSSGGINLTLGGKRIDSYACSNEIVNHGALSGKMCGIGTACHEFGHAMGLPDFYDTDYEDNEEASALFDFSPMCGGGYNNDGRTPPYFNIEERMILGWIDSSAMTEVTQSGQYSLSSVNNNLAYKASTDTEGEYFYFEARDGQGWDAPLPTGLVIYHVDKSTSRKVGDYYTPYELWSNWSRTNSINAWGDHPCFYIIPSSDPTSLYLSGYDYGYKDDNDVIFPGRSRNTSYQPIDWDGNETSVQLSSIAFSSGNATFTATVSNTKGVSGTVTDSSGNPLQGVTISVVPSGQNNIVSHGKVRIISIREATAGAQYTAQTDAQGRYEIDLQDCTATTVEVSATLDGYLDNSKTITLKTKGNVVNFVLYKEGESVAADLYKFDPNGSVLGLGTGDASDELMMAVRFQASELTSYVGNLIKEVTILPACSASKLYIIIDFGTTRALTYEVPSPTFDGNPLTVSLESKNLHIPENKDVYIGYGMKSTDNGYPFGCIQSSTFHYTYYDLLNLTSSDWSVLSSSSGYFDLALSAKVVPDGDPGTVTPPEEETDYITTAGFNYISVPKDFEFTAGAELPLKVNTAANSNPSNIIWTLDGLEVGSDSIVLTRGNHTLRATLYFRDGSDETIELEMEVL